MREKTDQNNSSDGKKRAINVTVGVLAMVVLMVYAITVLSRL
ncbi:MAG: hypothetical protein VX086_01395 [Pseudomonadota bacterium]|nr:hypothetical protein [Pseudomonadota bacterium]